MADNSLIRSERRGGNRYLTLSRPQRHNALVPELMAELNQALADAAREAPDSLVLTAEGQSFSTGGDVQAFYDCPRDHRADYAEGLVAGLHEAIVRLVQLPCPTLARVQGQVTGGSCGLLLACDLVALHERAHWTPWYGRVGFAPDGGWTTLMADRIGRHRTLAIHLRNRSISPDEAVQWGLADAVAPTAEALDRTLQQWLEELAQGIPGAAALVRRRLRPDAAGLRQQLDGELRDFVAQIGTREAEQGMQAFLETLRSSTERKGEADHGTV